LQKCRFDLNDDGFHTVVSQAELPAAEIEAMARDVSRYDNPGSERTITGPSGLFVAAS
jgi:hypothetical protein